MKDTELAKLLRSHGFRGESLQTALNLLVEKGLTRHGKIRIAESKIAVVARIFKATFVRHCRKSKCQPLSDETRQKVLVDPKHCENCKGSDNQLEVQRMVSAMIGRGCKRLLVAGGSKGTRSELKRLCKKHIEIRFITDDSNVNGRAIEPLLAWSDVAVIWVSTEIDHKATAVLRGPKVLRVTRRSVAALAEAVGEHCAGIA